MPGLSVFPSGEPGVSGDSWGSQEGCQGLENPHGQKILVGYSPWGHKVTTLPTGITAPAVGCGGGRVALPALHSGPRASHPPFLEAISSSRQM